MQDEKAIKRRIKLLRDQYIQETLDHARTKLPHHCKFNYDHALEGGETIGLCMYGAQDPESWPGDICDSEDVSRICPKFEMLVSSKDLASILDKKMLDPDFLADHVPEIPALLWVLSGEDTCLPVIYNQDESWWIKLLRKIGIKS
jgi:hypothetical protein